MRYLWSSLFFLTVMVASILGIRGQKFRNPPLEVFPDMDRQDRINPQSAFPFWSNGSGQRPAVPRTVARGQALAGVDVFRDHYQHDPSLRPEFYTGKTQSGGWQEGFPIKINAALMRQGQEKFRQTCALCHGHLGDGKGITSQFGMVGAADLLQSRIRELPEGEIFQTITQGKGQMRPMAKRLTHQERWATILYLRALQRATQGTLEDIPDPLRTTLIDQVNRKAQAQKMAADLGTENSTPVNSDATQGAEVNSG